MSNAEFFRDLVEAYLSTKLKDDSFVIESYVGDDKFYIMPNTPKPRIALIMHVHDDIIYLREATVTSDGYFNESGELMKITKLSDFDAAFKLFIEHAKRLTRLSMTSLEQVLYEAANPWLFTIEVISYDPVIEQVTGVKRPSPALIGIMLDDKVLIRGEVINSGKFVIDSIKRYFTTEEYVDAIKDFAADLMKAQGAW